MAKVINIKWETDGYEIDLPNEVTIPDCFMDSDAGPDVDAISDWLSDMSGWLHDGFGSVFMAASRTNDTTKKYCRW